MVPTSYSFSASDVVSVNGSSITGRCSTFTNSSGTLNCTNLTSSVLFDGHIPILTGLDDDMWASQLLTMKLTTINPVITFDYQAMAGIVQRVEVVMFNCQQWGIGVHSIAVRTKNGDAERGIGSIIIDAASTVSCDSLVRVCMAFGTFTDPAVILRFNLFPNSYWIDIAEITFYSDSICPPDTTIIGVTPITSMTKSLRETTSAETTIIAAGTITPTPPIATEPSATTTTETMTTSEKTAVVTTTIKATTTAMTMSSTNGSTIKATTKTATEPKRTSETMQTVTTGIPVTTIVIIAISVVLLLLVVVVAAVVLLICWRYKHQHKTKQDTSSRTSSPTYTSQQQAINLQERVGTHEEQEPISLHTQRHDEAATFDDPEYSVVTTELPLPDSRKLSESEILSDHLYDQVDGKSEKKKAHTRQQDFEDEDHLYDEVDKKSNTTVPKSAMEKKNRGQQKFLPSKTAPTENHDEDLGSAPEEDQLYAQVNKSGRKKGRTQDTAQPPASQQNWLYQDDGHDTLAVSEQVTPEDHSYDRVEWNMGKEKESATSECQFHSKLEEGAGAASKEKVEHLQSEDSQYNIADMSSNSLAETPEEYFHLRHHEKSVPYFEENASFSASRTDQDDMYAQLEDSNAREVPRQQTAPHTMTERSQDHFYTEPEGEQGTKFPRKHIASHGKSHRHLYAEVEEKKVGANQTGPPPVTSPQDDLYSKTEERKVQTKSASLLRKSRDDRFTQPEEREVRMQPTPSDQPQGHLYAQPDRKKVRAKSSSLLSKSHDNLYAQPEERDVHTPLTSFASRDRLRKSHDHLYAELEEGKGNKSSKESMSCTSIKSGKLQTHEYAELEESAQPSLLSSQTSRASLKSKIQHAHVYAQLEEGEMCAQQSPLPPEELLYAEPEERKATKTRSTLPLLKCGKPHARLCSERDMQTQLSSLPPEEFLYAEPEERKVTKKCSTLPPLRGGKQQANLYAQLQERGASNVRATPPTTPVSSTPSNHLYAQLEGRETIGARQGHTTSTTLKSVQSQDDICTEEDTSDIRSTPPPAI